MKRFLFTPILCALAASALAQSKYDTWWVTPTLGYGWTLAEKGKHSSAFVLPDKSQYMVDFSFRLRYYLTPQSAVGANISVNAYRNYDMITVPLSLSLHHDFRKVPRLFAFTDFGIPLHTETASNNFFTDMLSNYVAEYSSGWILNAGAGYRLLMYDNYKFAYIAVAYNLFRYTLNISPASGYAGEPFSVGRRKHTILLRVGFDLDIHKIFQAAQNPTLDDWRE
jgi:hypothetical protein